MAPAKPNNTIKVAGQTFNIGGKLNAAELQKIAAKTGVSVSNISNKAKNQDVVLAPSSRTAVKSAVNAAAAAAAQQREQEITNRVNEALNKTGAFVDGVYTPPSRAGEEFITFADLETAREAANLQIQERIRKLENDGQTERLKYEVDNRIPLAQTEIKGKLDLQKIVNSGYKEISQLERGSRMMSNITSMFNF